MKFVGGTGTCLRFVVERCLCASINQLLNPSDEAATALDCPAKCAEFNVRVSVDKGREKHAANGDNRRSCVTWEQIACAPDIANLTIGRDDNRGVMNHRAIARDECRRMKNCFEHRCSIIA